MTQHRAIEFLKRLDSSPDARFNIEHYTDVPKGTAKPKPDPLGGRYANLTLAEVDQLLPKLQSINDEGAGIFVARNQCDGHRSEANVSRIRGIHADMDNISAAQLAAVTALLQPSIIVQSSRGRYQLYWQLSDGELLDKAETKAANQCLVMRHGADAAAVDVSRLLRLPGFKHMKYRAEGRTPTVYAAYNDISYRADDIRKAFTRVQIITASTSAAAAAGAPRATKPLPSGFSAVAATVAAAHPKLWSGDWTNIVRASGELGYPSQSEADLALAGHIARACRSAGVDDGSIALWVESIFSSSPMGQSAKWQGREDYRLRTIHRALAVGNTQAVDSANTAEPLELLRPVSVLDVLTNPAPPPAFIWDDYLPRGEVTLFGAHGGTGKSTIALMLAVCSALGRPMFGADVRQCKTVFVSLEDGTTIVRYRLGVICRQWGVAPELLDGWLHVVDGTDHPELFSAERRGEGESTPTYEQLRQLANAVRAGLVIVDNASDAYGGDEIQRRQVRSFMRSLARIARLTGGCVLLLAHVDKTTSRNRKADGGEGYSGSTAWHNSARSRLFLTRGDDGLLTLEHQKNNFGRMQEPITLRWEANQLPHLLDLDAAFDDLRSKSFIETQTAVALLRLIADFESRGQYCSPALTSRNTVFAVLKSEPAFLKLKLRSDDTRRLLNQCQRAHWIEIVDYKSPDRKPRQRWGLTAQGREQLKAVAPSAPSMAVEESWHMAQSGAPSAPTCAGGVGGSARAHPTSVEVQKAVIQSVTAPTADVRN